MTPYPFTNAEREWLRKELGVYLPIKPHSMYKHYCVISESRNDKHIVGSKTQWRIDKTKEIAAHDHPTAKKLLNHIALFKIHTPEVYAFWYEL